jgi:hypothetical protein
MTRHTDSEIASGKVCSAFPILYFVDLIPEPSHHQSAQARGWGVMLAAFQIAFEAAAESALLLQQETIDIAQRNVNSSFCLLRKLVGAKSFGVDFLFTGRRAPTTRRIIGPGPGTPSTSTKAAADMAEPIEAYKLN